MDLSLLILAAGMGSRFGGLKQIEPVGAHGEIIIDYSIHDARRAGFSQIVLVIRREHESAFREIFDRRYSGVEVEYVFQDLTDLPENFRTLTGREKPWGTGQAVWAARAKIKNPFAMINADDFYGADSFRVVADFLRRNPRGMNFCLAGYKLAKTLSEFGAVSRGVCEIAADGNLRGLRELTKIRRVSADLIVNENGENREQLSADEIVSMNFFGFTPDIFLPLGDLFADFLRAASGNPKAAGEFYIPFALDALIRRKLATVKILPTSAEWMGMTYRDDHAILSRRLAELATDYVGIKN